MDLKLILAKGETKGKEVTITKASAVIGRDPEADVVVASPKVSRKHCRIEVHGDKAVLVDEGSGNGTFINGQKVTQAELHPGDKVVVGPLGFVVQINGQRKPAAPKPATAAAPPADAEAPAGDDLNDVLASLEKGAAPADDDIIELTDEDLT